MVVGYTNQTFVAEAKKRTTNSGLYVFGNVPEKVGSFDTDWRAYDKRKLKKVVIVVHSNNYGSVNVLNKHSNKGIKIVQ